MTKDEFIGYCKDKYETMPDYPFEEDFETAVLRHKDNKKWYALIMKISRSKLGINSEEVIHAVNLKLPIEMFGSFGVDEGVYPAYHMNKRHWISLILEDCDPDTAKFLADVSYSATKNKRIRAK